MQLIWIDWLFIIGFFVISMAIGLAVTRRAGKNSTEYFAAGRHMPWWLLGVSMVATTFSTDTPNLVTNIVRQDGVAGNWTWWAFLLTGMVTVFIYARLWKRSGVLTDIEFYELRYSGPEAAFLRGFRALYLGIFFNVIIMASVSLAAIKMGSVMLGLQPWQTLLCAALVVVVYSVLGGLRGVLLTDLFQFGFAMLGSIAAAIFALRHESVGGLSGLLANESLQGHLRIFPDLSNQEALFSLLIFPFAVMWWSVWYPGAEPGGGGYIAQRMLSAKDESNATGAVFLFNAAHYALRPWPWIIVALCSMLVYPDIKALSEAFPHTGGVVADDMAYPAMLTLLPVGLLGLTVASLAAAYMSTMSTHLNWGASYIVHDFYHRFLRPESSEKELVLVGRLSTLGLMILTCLLALLMESALDNFRIMLEIGAGTGLLFLLRWFWWRINAYSEIAAMVISFVVALFFRLLYPRLGLPPLEPWQTMTLGVAITTTGWLLVTYLTQPTRHETLVQFYRLIQPGGPGWKAVHNAAAARGESLKGLGLGWQMPRDILCVFLGCMSIYTTTFATGYWLYGEWFKAMLTTVIALGAILSLIKVWQSFSTEK